MKLKEIDRNGNITWSPKVLDRSYLVVGTASQQIDSSFSSKAQLEIFEYIPNAKGCDMPLIHSLTSDHKFSKLLWGNISDNYGLIVCGSDTGTLSIYDCKTLLNEKKNYNQNSSSSLILREHKGPVHAMDFNKFKTNLLATGGAESDIFIWDLDKYDEPMTPGNKSQPFEEIRNLSWNHKVQHILGSTSTHRCQIWDLRKSDPVIKLSDTQMKMKCNKLVWHPEISTRLCISSEDDHTPVIQLWDLRYIQCPFHTLQRHTKGIIDLEWNIDDPDILMSVGRDRQIICWNMSTSNSSSSKNTSSEVIYEWQLDQELINEANFLPKHPGLVSVSSFDCHISIYSLMGGQGHVSRELSDTVIDSFPMELFEDDNEIERVKKEAEKAAELQLAPTPCISKAPKWLKRPCGASFSFGGRLIQFCKTESSRSRNNSISNTVGSTTNTDNVYRVIISQVTTHTQVVKASVILENACQNSDSLLQYCQDKIDSMTTQISQPHDTHRSRIESDRTFDLDIWKFIECHFFEDSRSAFMQNLGYGNANLRVEKSQLNENNDNFLNNQYENSYHQSENINEHSKLPIDNIQLLPRFEGNEKLLAVSLMTGDIETAIDICLKDNRSGEAAILAVSSGRQDLFEKVQNSIFETKSNQMLTTNLIHIAVKRNWQELAENCDLRYWKETLVWLLTYASTDELSELCEVLGRRLEDRATNDPLCSLSACICYICSGSIENFVRCWLRYNSFQSTKDLQRLIEMVVVLCKSVGDMEFSLIKGEAAHIFRRYALLLVSQGNLSTALRYLGSNEESNIIELRHRICEGIRNNLPDGILAPKSPFKVNLIFGARVNNPNLKSLNKPVRKISENSISNNQKLGEFPGPGDYQMRQVHYSGGQIKSPKLLSNEHQFNYGNNSPLNYNLPMSAGSMSQNYYQAQYAPQPPSPKLPFLPPGGSSFMPGNTSSQISTPPLIQKPISQINKSAWNDPPLLSENYRQEEANKEEIIAQTNFFNPASNVTNISDFVNFDNKIATNVNLPMGAPSGLLNSFTTMNNTIDRNLTKNFEIPYAPPKVDLIPDKKIEKLSPEYEHIQSVLIGLIEKCRLTDKSRQIKVKMDDIEKKINDLFEILRLQSLSTELTNGLKSLISTLEGCHYRQSFDEVNHLIQTVNFSEAGLYLPSVKMLIQCAIKILG